MAAASPTPMGSSSFGDPSRRPSYRHVSRNQPSRPNLRRGSPLSTQMDGSDQKRTRDYGVSMGDSSDEDIPAPMKFSALTKALLNDEASVVESSSPSNHPNVERVGDAIDSRKEPSHAGNRPASIYELDQLRRNANTIQEGSPAIRRVVRLSGGSISPITTRRSNSAPESPLELITPAPVSRRTLNKSSGNSSGAVVDDDLRHTGSPGNLNDGVVYPTTIGRPHTSNNQGSVSRFGSSTIGRARHEETIAQGSIRVKRVGKVTGSFLSGPARRGRRRQSEEDQSPDHDMHISSQSDGPPPETEGLGAGTPDAARSSEKAHFEHLHSGQDVLPTQSEREPQVFNSNTMGKGPRSVSPSVMSKRFSSELVASRISSRPASPDTHLHFKVPGHLPSSASHDQENEPPPTFKRNKPSAFSLLDKVDKNPPLDIGKALNGISHNVSPSRKALAPRSHNTPHRPAPPPPKMSVLETATATAGSAATTSRKKRINITLNGKTYTRMDLIGRGGSARVYRVMAENHKIFALKKVSLEDVDQLAIRGYKGEIDLLRKLEGVDRVVRLYDWEINEEKQTLSVLMEIGESDLSRVLTVRLNSDNAMFDISFARHYWKEMLECVQSIHQFDIVHSDLKPANFLLVKGRLQLIDFGIANAIQDDTVNVHREQQVGTPNYMAPEAIVDWNAKSGLPATMGRLMKLGKPSDVWSLGCILYQITYGKPPYAHISNPIQRVMAIANPQHIVEYHSTGVGGVAVPSGLIKTLKGCLEHDPQHRMTIERLLDSRDPFLYPDAAKEGTVEMTQDLLGCILANAVKYCKNHGIPTEEELAHWPAGFFAKIKDATVDEPR